MTEPRERAKYSAIIDRPNLPLPNGARMVVWTIVNVEVWDIARRMPRQVLPAPTGDVSLPDVPHWSWHEYGARVGFWRFFELYQRLNIRPTLAINARVCLDYPRLAQACRDANWEFMAHSFEQGPIHLEKDQPAMIERTLSTLEKFTGKRPVGWLGPGLTETYDTPDHLSAAGIKYIGDWVYDEEPTEIATKSGPLVTLPYSIELNDITLMVVQHHEAAYWTKSVLMRLSGFTKKAPRAQRSWRLQFTRISAASHSESNITRRFTITLRSSKASYIGMAKRFWTGIPKLKNNSLLSRLTATPAGSFFVTLSYR